MLANLYTYTYCVPQGYIRMPVCICCYMVSLAIIINLKAKLLVYIRELGMCMCIWYNIIYRKTIFHQARDKRTYMRAYIHTCVHTYVHTYVHACVRACIHTHTHTHIQRAQTVMPTRRIPIICFDQTCRPPHSRIMHFPPMAMVEHEAPKWWQSSAV